MSRLPFDPDCGLDISTTTIRDLADIATIQYYGFRVVRHPDDTLYVHEAYYDYREGLLGIARRPANVCADTFEELETVLEAMADGMHEPILAAADLITRGLD